MLKTPGRVLTLGESCFNTPTCNSPQAGLIIYVRTQGSCGLRESYVEVNHQQPMAHAASVLHQDVEINPFVFQTRTAETDVTAMFPTEPALKLRSPP